MQMPDDPPCGAVGLEDGKQFLGDDGVVFSTVGVHFKQSNALSQPVSDLEPWGKRMSGIGDAFGGIGREGGRVVSPVRIRRRVRPDLGHVAKGEKGSGLTQALLDPG